MSRWHTFTFCGNDWLYGEVGECSEHLLAVTAELLGSHYLSLAFVGLDEARERLGDVLEHEVEILLLLQRQRYLILVLIEEAFKFDDVGVVEMLRNLQLAVLVLLVLQHMLDCEQAIVRVQHLQS